MAKLGSLIVDMRLQSAAFMRDMKAAAAAVNTNTAKIRKSMRQVEIATRSMTRQFGQARSAAVALAGAFAVRQFSTFTKNAIEAGAAVKDVAAKVGLTTTELQQLRFAAAQTGVKVTALDMGMQRFSRRLGEVAQGQGELLKTAKQYDIKLRESNGVMRANIDVLRDFADVIKNAESDQERLRIAFKLFDSEGAALVNMLRDGRVGLEKFMDQAIAFGAVMTRDVVAQAKLAGDNLTTLQLVFGTSFDTAIIKQFAGGLTLTRENLEAVRQAGVDFGQAVGAAMRGVVSVAAFVGRHMREIATALASIAALKAAGMILGLAGAVVKFTLALVSAARAGAVLNTLLSKSVLGVVAKLAITLGAAALTWEAFGKEALATAAAIEKAAKNILSGTPSVEVNIAAVKESTEAFKRENEQIRRQIEALKTSAAEYRRVSDEIKVLNEAHRLGVSAADDQAAAWLRAIEANQQLKREMEGLQARQQELARIAEGAFDRIGDCYEEYPPELLAEPAVRAEIELELERITL